MLWLLSISIVTSPSAGCLLLSLTQYRMCVKFVFNYIIGNYRLNFSFFSFTETHQVVNGFIREDTIADETM